MSHPITLEVIVLIVRQTGWTLEYVGRLPVERALKLAAELRYQQSCDDYIMAGNFAMLLANWATAQGRRQYRVAEFIGPPPRRAGQEEKDIWEIAEENRIRTPRRR